MFLPSKLFFCNLLFLFIPVQWILWAVAKNTGQLQQIISTVISYWIIMRMVDDLNILKQSQLRWLNWDIIFQMVNGDCFDHGKYMSQLFAIIPRTKRKNKKMSQSHELWPLCPSKVSSWHEMVWGYRRYSNPQKNRKVLSHDFSRVLFSIFLGSAIVFG